MVKKKRVVMLKGYKEKDECNLMLLKGLYPVSRSIGRQLHTSGIQLYETPCIRGESAYAQFSTLPQLQGHFQLGEPSGILTTYLPVIFPSCIRS